MIYLIYININIDNHAFFTNNYITETFFLTLIETDMSSALFYYI